MIRDLQRNHPTAARDVMRTTRVRSKVERSRAYAPLTKTPVWDSGFFAHALFVPKNPNVMGFSGSVNGTTKNPGFGILVFANVNGPFERLFHNYPFLWNFCKLTPLHGYHLLDLTSYVRNSPSFSSSCFSFLFVCVCVCMWGGGGGGAHV